MKSSLQQWIIQRPPPAGVYAWGISGPDHSSFNCPFVGSFSREAMDNAWRGVADTVQVLRSQHRQPARRLRWVFENGWLYCCLRGDGFWLGVFTTNHPDHLDLPGLEQAMLEFEGLA